MQNFIKRYTPSSFLEKTLLNFGNQDLQDWLELIGIPMYIGTSNRVFPLKGIKPIEVLQAIEALLAEKQVKIEYGKTWQGWGENNALSFKEGESVKFDIQIFALGGGSWKVTGSDGTWLPAFADRGIETIPFQASNCAYTIDWEADFIARHEGAPLKNIAISCGRKTQKGEAVITKEGMEGNAIYALSPIIRHRLNQGKKATIYLDFKTTLTEGKVFSKLKRSRYQRISDSLKNDLKLSSTQIALLKAYLPKEEFLEKDKLAQKIKSFPLEVIGSSEIDAAISTVGGISLSEVDENLQLKALPQQYCIGEMLDWDAPTGGYLLQACFSMGYGLAEHLNRG